MYLMNKPRGNKKIINSYAVINLNNDSFVDCIIEGIDETWKDSTIVSGYSDAHKSDIRTNTEQKIKINSFGDPIVPIINVIDSINHDFWNFDLTGINLGEDHPSIFRYNKGQKFDWHFDVTHKAPTRKLGFSFQLSSSEDYEGGDLEIFGCSSDPKFREKGALIVFPSYVWHRVTPVTKGERIAMVGWIHGPTFQ